MNKKEKLEANYKAQLVLYPEKDKELNMLVALSKVVPQVLSKIQQKIADNDDLDFQMELLATEFDELAEVLEQVSLKYNINLGIDSLYIYMFTYHSSLVQLSSRFSKYKDRFEDLINYISYLKYKKQ